MGTKRPIKISYLLYKNGKACGGKAITRISEKRASQITSVSKAIIAPDGSTYYEFKALNGMTERVWFKD